MRLQVYYTVLLALLFVVAPAAGQVDLSVEPAMTRGPDTADVVIVEFTDYQ